ncbi:MAG: hypothetical protein NT022_13355, partial [Deltaproteobacteria bacterium]|nr:hypothetical protein [Deltaproteobacteria bacterium]
MYDDPATAWRLTVDLYNTVKKKLESMDYKALKLLLYGQNQAARSFNKLIRENKATVEAHCGGPCPSLGQFGKLDPDLIRNIAQLLPAQYIMQWIKASPKIISILQPISAEQKAKFSTLWSINHILSLQDCVHPAMAPIHSKQKGDLITLWTNKAIVRPWKIAHLFGSEVMAVAFSPQSLLLAFGDYSSGTIKLMNIVTADQVIFCDPNYVENSSEKGLLSLAFSLDGKSLVSGYEDGSIRFWDVL